MTAYYNEIEPYAAQWLRNLIAANLIPAGEVDERSIVDVAPDDLRRFRQCHFFAGVAGWGLAARLAGWPDSRELWTGSAPCQPFSVAGQGKAQSDDRHLWPHFFRLIRSRRPAVVMGEQVAAAVGKNWLDGIAADLEGIGYSCDAAIAPACSVNAPHRRDRLWFVADANGLAGGQGDPNDGRCADGSGSREVAGPKCAGNVAVAHADHAEWRAGVAAGHVLDGAQAGRNDGYDHPAERGASDWHGAGWIIGHDGKARRVEPGIRLLANGVPARVGKLRAYGNAIVPAVAAEVIGAYMDCRPA